MSILRAIVNPKSFFVVCYSNKNNLLASLYYNSSMSFCCFFFRSLFFLNRHVSNKLDAYPVMFNIAPLYFDFYFDIYCHLANEYLLSHTCDDYTIFAGRKLVGYQRRL